MSRKRLDGAPDIDALLGGPAPRKKARKRGGGPAEPGSASVRPKGLSAARFLTICLAFAGVMLAALLRFADMAAEGGAAPEAAAADGIVNEVEAATLAKTKKAEPRRAPRAAIVDRHGAPLARDIATYELYLDRAAYPFPDDLREAAERLAEAFPHRFEAQALLKRIRGRETTLLDRPLTAREAQRAHDLGLPGVYLTPRHDRIYPAGPIASHVVGWVDVDGDGRAGVESRMDAALKRAPEQPLRLSLDLRIQRSTRQALATARQAYSAKAAAAIVLSVETGEVLAMVSLPDFDPHNRPPQPQGASEEQEKSPLFHRAMAAYELGSVMKTVTFAAALEHGVASMGEAFESLPTLSYGAFKLPWKGGAEGASLPAAFARSLNRVAAELALRVGRGRQAELFRKLGLKARSPLEVAEAPLSAPKKQRLWLEVDTVASSYGYRVKVSAAQMAAAMAGLVNGGEAVRPTLLRREDDAEASPRPRVVSAETSRRVRELLRLAVASPRGTGRRADVPGLRVGGKTGTAWKHGPDGYDVSKTRASFAAAFPIEQPKLVVVVTLDEPTTLVDGAPNISATHTAAPTAGAIIAAAAPLAGVAPRYDREAYPTATTRPTPFPNAVASPGPDDPSGAPPEPFDAETPVDLPAVRIAPIRDLPATQDLAPITPQLGGLY